MFEDILNNYSKKEKEYYGTPVRWDEDNIMDASYGSDFRLKQKKTEYEEHDITKTDPRLRKLARVIIEEGIQLGASDIIILPQENFWDNQMSY